MSDNDDPRQANFLMMAERDVRTNGYNLDAGRLSPTRRVQQEFLAAQLVD
jgi:hypothetical protein